MNLFFEQNVDLVGWNPRTRHIDIFTMILLNTLNSLFNIKQQLDHSKLITQTNCIELADQLLDSTKY